LPAIFEKWWQNTTTVLFAWKQHKGKTIMMSFLGAPEGNVYGTSQSFRRDEKGQPKLSLRDKRGAKKACRHPCKACVSSLAGKFLRHKAEGRGIAFADG
jgi:hypothetical protein